MASLKMTLVRKCSCSHERDIQSPKRLKKASLQATYPYPHIPERDQDLPEVVPRIWDTPHFHRRTIARTDSLSWGPTFIAAERALTESAVTPENEQLLRTHHRSLTQSLSVQVAREINGSEIWVIYAGTNNILDTHAGGREIHVKPLYISPDFPGYISQGIYDPINRELNPRRFLTAGDLNNIRNLYPQVVGARVLICGIVVLLFKSLHDMRLAWNTGIVESIGSLKVLYDVAEHTETRAEHWSYAVSGNPNNFNCSVCLGLRLKLPNGQEAITTVTHGFVELEKSKSKTILRLTDWVVRIKNTLSRFAPIRTKEDVPGLVTLRESAGNSPLGKTVWIGGTNRKVGTITATYDPLGPKKIQYPIGFTHDLSLITGNDLPELSSPPGLPTINGWGEYSDVLDGGPVFVSRINACTGVWRQMHGTGVSKEAQRAVVAGTEYLWDRIACSQTASLLWRTEQISDAAGSFSGSVLCLGRLTDQVVKAVLFQNFETPVKPWILKEDHRGNLEFDVNTKGKIRLTLKGGFLLPREIRESEIRCLDNGKHRNFDTVPRQTRMSAECGRRSFSMPQ